MNKSLARAQTVSALSLGDQAGVWAGDNHPSVEMPGDDFPAGSLYFWTTMGRHYRKTVAGLWQMVPVVVDLPAMDGSVVPMTMIEDPADTAWTTLMSSDIKTFEFFESSMRMDEALTDPIGLTRQVAPWAGRIVGATLSAESVLQNSRSVALFVGGVQAGDLVLPVSAGPVEVGRFDLEIPLSSGAILEARDISTTNGRADQVAGVVYVRWVA